MQTRTRFANLYICPQKIPASIQVWISFLLPSRGFKMWNVKKEYGIETSVIIYIIQIFYKIIGCALEGKIRQ